MPQSKTIEADGLPAAVEAEKLILGSMLSGDVHPDRVREVLEAGDWSIEKHHRIFDAACNLATEGLAVTRITVYQALKDCGQAEASEGLGYLVDLERESIPGGIDTYLLLVRSKGVLRRAIAAARKLENECLLAQDPPAELLERAQRILTDLGDRAQRHANLRTVAEIIDAHPNGLNGFLQPEKETPGIRSPWPALNRIIAGFRRSQLIVIAGRTGFGKSAAACQIADAAASAGYGVALFSLEMSADEILARMGCARAGVNAHKFRQGHLSEVERFELQRAMTELNELPLRIDDSTGCTVPAIHAALRRLRAHHDVGLVLLDYLQLMEAPGRRENRVQEVSAITRGLKLLAREFGIPVVALAQLNRGPETEKRRPVLADLRESGSIEQDADTVIFIHQPEMSKGGSPELAGHAEFIVGKQRSGPRGTVHLHFHARYVRFEENAQEEKHE